MAGKNDQFIIENHDKMTYAEMAEELGVSASYIRNHARYKLRLPAKRGGHEFVCQMCKRKTIVPSKALARRKYCDRCVEKARLSGGKGKGARAYHMRRMEALPWTDIARRVGAGSGDAVMRYAMHFAAIRNLPWPVPALTAKDVAEMARHLSDSRPS